MHHLEGDLAYESLAHQWELNLIRTTDIDPNYISQVAYILAQDEILGAQARTQAQNDFMGRAVDSQGQSR